MADAQQLLEQVTKNNMQCIILRACIGNLVFPGVSLSPSTKAKVQAFKDDLQQCIDQLIAQREWLGNLVKQIPDGESQLVLQLRYGLLDNATKKMPWLDIPPIINYELETAYRRHRTGIDYLNEILEKEGIPEWHVGENATSKN